MFCYGWPLASERPFAVVRGAPSTEVAPLSPYTWPTSRPYQTHIRPTEMMLHAAPLAPPQPDRRPVRNTPLLSSSATQVATWLPHPGSSCSSGSGGGGPSPAWRSARHERSWGPPSRPGHSASPRPCALPSSLSGALRRGLHHCPQCLTAIRHGSLCSFMRCARLAR